RARSAPAHGDVERRPGRPHGHRVPAPARARAQARHRENARTADVRDVSGSRLGERSDDRQPRQAHPAEGPGRGSRLRCDRGCVRRRLSLRGFMSRARLASRLGARWRLSRIGLRLLAFNLLLLFLPVAGILYLDVYEARLLDTQERAMALEARLIAAALADQETLDPSAAERLFVRLRRAAADPPPGFRAGRNPLARLRLRRAH